MVVGTKGEGHCMWIIGTPGVMGQVKNMIYGPQARVGVGAMHTILSFAFGTSHENNHHWAN